MNDVQVEMQFKVSHCMHPPGIPARFEAVVGDEVLVSSAEGAFFANIVSFGAATLRVARTDGVVEEISNDRVLALSLSELG